MHLPIAKKNNPSGANIIRYKVNGQQIEITGKYNNLNLNGVDFSEDLYQGQAYSIGGKAKVTYDRVLLVFPKNFSLNNITNIDSTFKSYITCTLGSSNQQYLAYMQTAVYKISVNNNNFISGSFSGKLLAYSIGPNPNDSLIITDGYFDISKN